MGAEVNRSTIVRCCALVFMIALSGALATGCAALGEPAKPVAKGSADAAGSAPIKIGVVNPQAVLERSNAGRGAIEQLKEFIAEKRKITASDEAEIKALDQKLKEQDKTFTDAQRQERQRQLATRVQQYQQKTQQLNQEIAAKQKALTNEYMQKIKSAIRAAAQEAGVTVVLHEGNEANMLVVLYHEPSVDLTERVLQEFNRQNP